MFCPECGAANAGDARFCANCGSPLPAGAAPPGRPEMRAPMAYARPTPSVGQIPLFGIITLALVVLALVAFFVMSWEPGSVARTTGWDLVYNSVIRFPGQWFEGLGQTIEQASNGTGSWGLAIFGIATTLLWVVPLQLIIVGVYGVTFVAAPSSSRRIRAKTTAIIGAVIVLIVFAVGAYMYVNDMGGRIGNALGVGFWITLVATAALFVIGIVLVSTFVPEHQR